MPISKFVKHGFCSFNFFGYSLAFKDVYIFIRINRKFNWIIENNKIHLIRVISIQHYKYWSLLSNICLRWHISPVLMSIQKALTIVIFKICIQRKRILKILWSLLPKYAIFHWLIALPCAHINILLLICIIHTSRKLIKTLWVLNYRL